MSFTVSIFAFLTLGANAQTDNPPVLPSDFERMLAMPGSDQFLRPGQVFFDAAAGEVYVVDQGHNRIVIFDQRGTYRFEFSAAAYCGSVRDLVVTSKGEILLLGSTEEGLTPLRFDFDGLYLGRIDVPSPTDGLAANFTALSIDSQDRVYLLDESFPRVVRFTSDLTIDAEFRVLGDVGESQLRDAVYGSMRVAGDELLLPVSSLGMVHRYGLEGEFRGAVGYQGSAPGEMTFPTAAAKTSDGMLLVLDKQRFMVLCYAPDGRFLGEFGGMGISPGWFYFPTWMTVDAGNRIYISQVFLNRVQVCRFPEAIRLRLVPPGPHGDLGDGEKGSTRLVGDNPVIDNIGTQHTNHVILTHKPTEVQHA